MDAIVALMVISLATILSLQALQQAEQAVSTATEFERAATLMSNLLETGPRTFFPHAGEQGDFSWRLDTQATGFDRPIAICRRAVSLVARGSGRTFTTSTLEICPTEGAS